MSVGRECRRQITAQRCDYVRQKGIEAMPCGCYVGMAVARQLQTRLIDPESGEPRVVDVDQSAQRCVEHDGGVVSEHRFGGVSS